MVQTINPDKKIVIHLECFDGVNEQIKYVAWIEGVEYKGIVVEGESLADCLQELSISLLALESYRKNTKK